MAGITFYLRRCRATRRRWSRRSSRASPLFGYVPAYLVLGETLTGTQLAGGALIIVGVLSVSIGGGPNARDIPLAARRR